MWKVITFLADRRVCNSQFFCDFRFEHMTGRIGASNNLEKRHLARAHAFPVCFV